MEEVAGADAGMEAAPSSRSSKPKSPGTVSVFNTESMIGWAEEKPVRYSSHKAVQRRSRK